jgi:tRNA threonylcarbamoyladenosine biosynthesis protein TsaB
VGSKLIVLALDTSTAAGSAAIVRDGAVAAARDGDGSRMHGRRLPLELMAVLRDAGVELADIGLFAVAVGPGSFTGLRVGIATIQGLALAKRARAAPVSTFEALAFHARGGGDRIATWIDAHRGEVFASLYESDGRTLVEPPSSLTPEATLDAWSRTSTRDTRIAFAGDGAVRYADVIRARLGDRAVVPGRVPSLADAVGLIAAADPSRAVAPHALAALYVRRPDVELTRDKRQAAKP